MNEYRIHLAPRRKRVFRQIADFSMNRGIEKKKQKTFGPWTDSIETPKPNLQKFFGSFFQKRTLSFSFRCF